MADKRTLGVAVKLALVAAFALGLLLLALLVSDAQGNVPLLDNPSFEEPYTMREAGEVKVAAGWDYAYLAGDDRECRAPCNRPEWGPEAQDKYVVHGERSQRWASKFSRHFGAVHQSVDAEPGAWYEFSCDVLALSDPPGDLGVFVGINPWAGGVFDRTMIWGRESVGEGGWIYGEFVRVSVTAQAWGDKIRVAAASNNAWATRDNTVYVDACSIRRVDVPGNGGETPVPCPTCAPCDGTPAPGGCGCADVRAIMREELDRSRITH